MRRRPAGFTLVEIMIVVAIICLLAVLAVPSLLRARERTQKTRFITALRVVRDACDLFVTENNGFPADVNRGILPAGMATYFNGKLNWNAPTPIGGRWDWDYKVLGITAGVSVVSAPKTVAEMTEIDAMCDDGSLTTGAFRRMESDRYTWILEN